MSVDRVCSNIFSFMHKMHGSLCNSNAACVKRCNTVCCMKWLGMCWAANYHSLFYNHPRLNCGIFRVDIWHIPAGLPD